MGRINTNANNTTGNSKTPTGGGAGTGAGGTGTGGTGSGGNANTNNGNGGNHPRPGLGGRPFPGRFRDADGHGPVVGGPVGVGGPMRTAVAVPPAPGAGGAGCLTKDYLQTGVVMFRDVCSQEWAIGKSTVAPAPANSACLTKVNPQNGVVLFRDICTSEWAMNPQPADNQTQAN